MRSEFRLPLCALAAALAGTLALAGCGDSSPGRSNLMASSAGGPEPRAEVGAAPPIARDMAVEAPSTETPPVEPPPGEPGEPGEPGVPQAIAYSHGIGLRLPFAKVEALLEVHTAACRAAGPATCIIINSWTNRNAEDSISATLSLKATPAWIEGFLGGVDKVVETAGGEITSRSTTAQDLTRQIIDTEARLKALAALRQRLESLLATRAAGLQDLLATERELARVNGEFDSLTTTIRSLRLRVAMSDLTINYETRERPVTATTFDPLADALSGFLRNFTAALGAAITALATGLPWLLLAGLVLWLWVRLLRPRFRRARGRSPD